MIRTSKHNISNITNQGKINFLEQLFVDYKHDLELYISLIINGTLPLKINISSALLPTGIIAHSKYKREIYKQASQIIRSQIDKAKEKRFNKYKIIYSYFKKQNRQINFINKRFSELNIKNIISSKYFTNPNINNISINLTNEFYDIQNGNSFDSFLALKLPHFNEKGTRAVKINIPLKNHKHSNKLRDAGFKLRNNIQLKQVKENIFINFIWEKEIKLKSSGRVLGIDTGYRKLISTSDNQSLGTDEMTNIYKSIINKKKNSKAYKNGLKERDNLINNLVNKIDLKDINTVVIEDLKNVKYKSQYNNKVNDLIARWTYRPLLNRIEMICEVKGISLVKVSPAYTSQTCSLCGAIHKESREGDLFKCIDCGYEIDSDYNASINIRNKGVYSPLVTKSKLYGKKECFSI